MTVRRAAPDDAAGMAMVMWRAATLGYEGIFPPGVAPVPPQEQIAAEWQQAIEQQRAGTAIFVACHGDPEPVVVGTVAAAADPADGGRAHLRAMYVDPAWWGRGVASRLHDVAVRHMRHVGFRMAVLWVLESNARARTMYERWGWQRSSATRPTGFPGVEESCYLRML